MSTTKLLAGVIAGAAITYGAVTLLQPATDPFPGPVCKGDTCRVPVIMNFDGGQCVFKVENFVGASKAVQTLRWEMTAATGSTYTFEFDYQTDPMPVFVKLGSRDVWRSTVSEPTAYAVSRAPAQPAFVVYGIRARYKQTANDKEFKACPNILDPIIVSME
jgi:hypothetical protein